MNVGEQIAEALDRLLETELGPETLRAAERGEWPGALHEALLELGLGEALVGEAIGGHGLGWSDIAPALRILGAHAVPLPVGEDMLARAALAEAGVEAPPGILTIATRQTAEPRLVGTAVTGELRAMIWPSQASHAIFDCTGPEDDVLAVLPLAGIDRTPAPSLSRLPHETAILEDVQPLHTAPAGGSGVVLRGALLRVMQISGALNRVLDLCVDYATTRVQFGRPIGKFQAIQQLLATMASEVAAANAITEASAQAMDAGAARPDAARLTVAVAKARCSTAAGFVANAAHEVHAAIGVTEELGLHFLTRRLWQWRDDFGSEHHWHGVLGRMAFDAGADGLWPLVIEASGGAGG